LPVGRSEDGTLYRLRQHGRHVLIAGASGAGKASVLWSQVAALAPLVRVGSVVLHGIDPKRMELVFAPELFARLTTGTPADAADHLEELVEAMGERQDRMTGKLREHTATPDDPALVVIIDELASLTAYCTDRDAKKRVEAALSLLLSQGRAVGVYVVAALQDPRKDVVTFRDLFTTRIALRTTEAAHVDMILGDGALDRGAHCHRIPDTLPGVGYVLVEGAAEPVRVRFSSYLTDADIRALATTYRPGAPDPHAPALSAVEPAVDLATEPAVEFGHAARVVDLTAVELPGGVS
jgi:S-DNA-T family DNA segregation ATPase FtsK/SpoIIIE